MCVRSSLNTNKAPLTYCQLSKVNLSRINFRRKRFRPSRPENPLVSNYLRIDRTARQWRDECCLYLLLSLSNTPFHSLSLFLSLTHCTYYLFISSPLDLLLHSPYTIFPISAICTHYTRTPTYSSITPYNLLQGVTMITTHKLHILEYMYLRYIFLGHTQMKTFLTYFCFFLQLYKESVTYTYL